MNSWYNYIIPRRVFFLNTRPYRWFNFLLLKYPRDLEWNAEFINGTMTGNIIAAVPLGGDVPYVIGRSSDSHRTPETYYCFYGPKQALGFRSSMAEAMLACDTHYKRNYLGLSGIIN